MSVLINAGCSFARKPMERKAKPSIQTPDPANPDHYYFVAGNSYADLLAEKYKFDHLIDVSRDGGNNDTIVSSLIAGINIARSTYPGEAIVAMVGWSSSTRVELWYADQLISIMVKSNKGTPRNGMEAAYNVSWKPQYGWYRYQHCVQYALMYCKQYNIPLIQWNSLDVFNIPPAHIPDTEQASNMQTYQIIDNSVVQEDIRKEIIRMMQERSWHNQIRPHPTLYDGSNHPTQLAHELKAKELSLKYHSIMSL